MNKNIQLLKTLMCIMGVLSLLTSCQKSSTQKKSIDTSNPLFLVQAKMTDIPIPIGFTLDTKKSGLISNKTIFHYHGNLGIKKWNNSTCRTITFYQNEMEVNGWEIQDFSTEKEGLLFCRKANKSCAISIRPKTVRIVLNHKRHVAKKSTDDLINNKKVVLWNDSTCRL